LLLPQGVFVFAIASAADLRARQPDLAPAAPVAHARTLPAQPSNQALLAQLARDGHLNHQGLLAAIADQARSQVRIAEILLSRGLVKEAALYQAMSDLWEMALLDPAKEAPDLRLIDRFGPEDCLSHGLLPMRNLGGATLILTAYPEEMSRHSDRLTALFGPVTFALTPYSKLEKSINLLRGHSLARRAENRVAADLSCRSWSSREAKGLSAAMALLAVSVLVFPYQTYLAALTIVMVTMLPVTGLKLAALIASKLPAPHSPPQNSVPPTIARLPTVSLLVALYQESDISGRLIRRLSCLDYPVDLLDVILAVEEDDAVTRLTLARTNLPPWMRVALVPKGRIKTKPRALNFALNLCRGTIIGVYDAEDAPEVDQIRKVVQRFHERGAEVACLQGVLDYYNPTANWLARCFTLEYGGWFRVVLPGLVRLGLPIPLGGTTLFFRRETLLELGGWDAHNVTEDADLGIRLARKGYRTELIETTTYEEANCRAVPWVKQRSRWIKGYLMTYVVHMRAPVRTFRELGGKGFVSFQILMLGSLIQAFLAPILWSTLIFAVFAPAQDHYPVLAGLMSVLLPLTVASELIGITVLATGLTRSKQPINMAWVPSLWFYFPMAPIAAYKALWEAINQPFYWDKTLHGHLSGSAITPAARAAPSAAQRVLISPESIRSRVS
jgi:cellulose synthase/poly-beta-1,6-N-acetylglucosamine synthase-like glycosyltransferase